MPSVAGWQKIRWMASADTTSYSYLSVGENIADIVDNLSLQLVEFCL
jgi:hypothetical protein